MVLSSCIDCSNTLCPETCYRLSPSFYGGIFDNQHTMACQNALLSNHRRFDLSIVYIFDRTSSAFLILGVSCREVLQNDSLSNHRLVCLCSLCKNCIDTP